MCSDVGCTSLFAIIVPMLYIQFPFASTFLYFFCFYTGKNISTLFFSRVRISQLWLLREHVSFKLTVTWNLILVLAIRDVRQTNLLAYSSHACKKNATRCLFLSFRAKLRRPSLHRNPLKHITERQAASPRWCQGKHLYLSPNQPWRSFPGQWNPSSLGPAPKRPVETSTQPGSPSAQSIHPYPPLPFLL